MLEIDKVYNEDCIDGMKKIPDKSIDLLLTDPPYNVKIAKWDNWKTVEEYVEWCGKWIKEVERVLKSTGSFYFFHNDMEQISRIVEWIRVNTSFVFNSFIVWDKGDFRALSWKNPTEDNNLRSWFNTCEYCLVYTFQDGTGLEKVMLDPSNFVPLRKYAYKCLCYIGGGNQLVQDMWKEVLEVEKQNTFSIASLRSIPNDPKGKAMDALGGKVDHFTRYGSTQWDICTPETYQELIDVFHIDKMEGYKEYESLRQEYESLRQEYESLRQEYESLRFTHNLAPNHKNVWRSSQRNNGQLHPTQKPTDILSKIIKCSSNEGGIVLDPFMGTFSTAISCLSSRRHFIGFELDTEYYKWGNERVKHYLRMRNKENIEDCFK